MTLRAVQGWVARQSPSPALWLRCAEASTAAPDAAVPATGAPATGAPDTAEVVAVRLTDCASQLVLHEVAELVALGAPSVTVDLAGCSAPTRARAHLAPLLEQVAALGITAVQLREQAPGAPADPPASGAAVEVDAAHPPHTRRQALLLDSPPDLPDESLPAHVRLREALLAVADGEGLAADSPAPVLTAPGCDTCGVCVRSCPFDALKITEVPAGGDLSITTLAHGPASCDGCQRCIELCPPQVLTTRGHHSWQLVQEDATVPVHTVPTRRCERCSARMPAATAGRRCAPCEQRRRNPFVATWPPSLTR